MNNKVYVVIEWHYDDYSIAAIFKTRDKAEAYVYCHSGCEIEEYEYNDDVVYTPMHYAIIKYHIDIGSGTIENYYIDFGICAEEENGSYHLGSHVEISPQNSNNLYICITKRLNDNYSSENIKEEYKKYMYDLLNEIKYEASKYLPYHDYKERDEFVKHMEKVLYDKFKIK